MSGTAAPGLFIGRVMHARTQPVRRRFTYRVFSLLLDVDDVATTTRDCAILSHNRFNVLSFYDRDHGRRDGSPLRPWVEDCLARAGIGERPDAIRVLCFPRLWGIVFNPISVFYCYRRDRLSAVIYEVNNTFGETHAYVAPIVLDDRGVARHRAGKTLYVSPLIGMQAQYDFALREPGGDLSFAIKETGDQGLILSAVQTGARRKLSTWEAIKAVAGHPLMTLKVLAAIHAEALGTWLRGVRYVPRPVAPSVPVSRAEAVVPGRRDDALPSPPEFAMAAE